MLKSAPMPVRVWDLPTRLFHWAIVVCIPLSWWSAENENYELHEWLGYTVIVLVITMLIGIGILMAGKDGEPVQKIFDSGAVVMQKVTMIVM